MSLAFRETAGFAQRRDTYFVTDEHFRAFQNALIEVPTRGAVIPGCSGLRKVRWTDARRGMGRRGGLRVIYLFVPDADMIFLLDVYDKNEADDLTKEEKREFAALADLIRQEVRQERGIRT